MSNVPFARTLPCSCPAHPITFAPKQIAYLAAEAVDVSHSMQPSDEHALLVRASRDVDAANVESDRKSQLGFPLSGNIMADWCRRLRKACTYTWSKRKARPPRPVNCLEMI
jgi:hypothetical protein